MNESNKKRRSPALLLVLVILALAVGLGGGYVLSHSNVSWLPGSVPASAQSGDMGDANLQLADQLQNLVPQSQIPVATAAPAQAVAPQAAPSGGSAGGLGDVVTGDGVLTAQDGKDVLTPAPVTIIQLPAKVGDEVVRGEVLCRIDKDKLNTTLSDLKAQKTAQDNIVKSLSGAKAETTVYSPVKGRVKKLFAEKGQDVQTVINRDGALALISTDGLMKVTFEPASWDDVRPGAEVSVKNQNGISWDGRVASVSDASGEITVTFTDDGPKLDEQVSVYLGSLLGSAPAQINAPLTITATGGIVKTVYPKDDENSQVSKGGSLFALEDVPISDDYNAALTKRQDLIDQINQCNSILDSGEILAPESGIVDQVYGNGNITNNPLSKDTAILSIASSEKLDMVVQVDEMDVVRLRPGQPVSVSVTALGGQTFEGSVKKIASVGKIVGGIAMYDVTIDMENAPGMRVSMSGTAKIDVAE